MWSKRKHRDPETFRQEILTDPAAEREFARCTSPTEAIDLALTLAQQRGYRLSRGEVEQILALPPLEPLSEAELAQIGGGSNNPNDAGDGFDPLLAAAHTEQHTRRRRLMSTKD